MITRAQLKKLSPVEIRYQPCRNLGAYYYPKYDTGQLKSFIEIDDDLEPTEQVLILLHEIGHAVHHIKNCKCHTDKNRTLAEYHAHRFIMKHIKGDNELIKEFVKAMYMFIHSEFAVERGAAKRIVKLKSYANLL